MNEHTEPAVDDAAAPSADRGRHGDLATKYRAEALLEQPEWRERAAAATWDGLAPNPGAGRESERVVAAPAALELVTRKPLSQRLLRAISVPVVAGIAVFVVAVGIAIAFTLVQVGETASIAAVGGESSASGAAAGSADGPAAQGLGVVHGAPVDESETPGTDTGAVAQGSASASSTSTSTSTSTVTVHVAGEVNTPGVVDLKPGARVADAISAAGGATSAGVLEAINLARVVTDGEQILVPNAAQAEAIAQLPQPSGASAAAAIGQADNSGQQGQQGQASGGQPLVNLNTADVAALETLPRIGPALAQRIIDWREAHGGFTSVDQLTEVSGVGTKTLEGMRDRLTV